MYKSPAAKKESPRKVQKMKQFRTLCFLLKSAHASLLLKAACQDVLHVFPKVVPVCLYSDTHGRF